LIKPKLEEIEDVPKYYSKKVMVIPNGLPHDLDELEREMIG
jgi:hypothetical protein